MTKPILPLLLPTLSLPAAGRERVGSGEVDATIEFDIIVPTFRRPVFIFVPSGGNS